MRHMLRLRFIAPVLFLCFCEFTLPAYADGESVSTCSGCNGYTFNAELTAGSTNASGTTQYTLTYTINNVSGNSAYAYNWSLTMFPNSDILGNADITSLTLKNTAADTLIADYTGDGLYTAVGGKSNNGGNGNCQNSVSGAVCIVASGTGAQIDMGESLNFVLTFDCSTNCAELADWTFLASGNPVSGNANGNVYAISTTGTPVTVPEPSMVTLFGAELLGVLGIIPVWRRVGSNILRRR